MSINAGAASVVTTKRPLETVSQDGDSTGAENDAKKPKMEEEEHVSNWAILPTEQTKPEKMLTEKKEAGCAGNAPVHTTRHASTC